MILTAQEEFGLRCALTLARAGRHASLTLGQVAEAEGLTSAYAGKLLRLLVQAGLVESTRGRSGGYCLTRDAAEITLREVVEPLGGPFYDGEICSKPAAATSLCVHNSDCAVRSVWSGMQGMVNEYLDQIRLGDLVSDEATMDRAMEEIRDRTVVQEVPEMARDPQIEELARGEYEHGWSTEIESDRIPKGLSEDIVRIISAKKEEPEWLLEWRLRAFEHFLTLDEPEWAKVHYPKIDLQDFYYYSAPKAKKKLASLDEVDPKLLETFDKLGIPLEEQKMLSGVAVDAVFDSVSVRTTFREKLAEAGVIFCSFSEAVKEHPELVKKYLGTVVPHSDNYYAALNSAVFSDGSFVWIPKGTRCPMELSTYFRINDRETGQFERTLIVAEEGAYVSYLEGCTAPQRDENQLHAAVVELVCLDDAEIKYSTVQNWYPGDEEGKGGIYNFVTKRGACRGDRSKISWTQVETGSAVTWKYPSCLLMGDNSVGEFYSVALTNNWQQADTGTKMVHIGRNTRSTIISKGISAGHAHNSYRGLVKVLKGASGARNYSQCDSLLIGDRCGAHTFPYIESRNPDAQIEHEATTSKISDDQLFYCRQRGLNEENAVSMIVNGFCKEVFNELPMEFAVEAQKLLSVSLEGAVG